MSDAQLKARRIVLFEPLRNATLEEIAQIPSYLTKPKKKSNLPCPFCGEWGGFHDDASHRQDIDPKYLLEKGWHNAS